MSKKSKRKTNIRSSILILLLIAILLVTSTYAWFTANTKVTVNNIDVHVEAKNGLQISTDAVNWKSVITNGNITEDAYNGHNNVLPGTMEPVSTVGEVDTTTGYMKMYYGTVTSNEVTGVSEITATQVTESVSSADNKFIAFDLFFKVDAETDIQLTTNSNVIPKTGYDDSGLKNAARVAFLNEGNQPAGSGASVYTALKSAQGLGKGDTYFWEPNSDAHTAKALESAIEFGIATDTSPVPYYGINSAFTTVKGDTAKVTLKDAMKGTNTDYFAQVTPSYSTNETMTATQVFTLTAGITKMRIYMWIEGQDVDCVNSASGSDISFNLQFEIV